MALIPCPGCGKQLSPEARRCPGCGHPIKAFYQGRDAGETALNVGCLIVVLVIGVLVALSLIG
jgi:uncharacterized membrane protein YvbJ